jgi:hypothetical protein
VAISVLDVRDTFVPPRVRVPARIALVPAPNAPASATATAARTRRPLTVLAAGTLGILEAVGLMATALTGIDGVLNSPLRPEGWMIALGLLVLAGWIVLCAGSGAALFDGAGRSTLVGVAYAEIALVGCLGVGATATPLFATLPMGLPLPALVLLALAVPVGKLLLAGAPASLSWVAQGPRARVHRPDPVVAHRMLATATLAFIGLALAAVAVLAPVQAGGAGPGAPASDSVFTG